MCNTHNLLRILLLKHSSHLTPSIVNQIKGLSLRFLLISHLYSGDGVFLPPHFYGELAKTQEGCETLEKSHHVSDFIQSIKNPSANSLERRAALYAIVSSYQNMIQLFKISFLGSYCIFQDWL